MTQFRKIVLVYSIKRSTTNNRITWRITKINETMSNVRMIRAGAAEGKFSIIM